MNSASASSHEVLNRLVTEQVNDRTKTLGELDSERIMLLINDEDRRVADCVRAIIPQIAACADWVVDAFRRGGRLFYVGAGTSGRIGILDASECPPTYGTDPSLVQGIIAGGFRAVKDPVEGAEDSAETGAADIDAHGIAAADVVVGIAASGRTPYVLGAMRRAKELGARVVALCNNADTPMAEIADLKLEAVVGPEAIHGSTRMKAGTTQKMILNLITTTAFVRSGKVYGNLMVDLNPSNEKLVHRAKRIIALATGAGDDRVDAAFETAGRHVKTAIVMLLANVDADRAKALLQQADGFVQRALDLHRRA
ncbi:N-acetylmuramic acid 6-phosphate etherase [Paenibacillus antri]|uniref:N-acetylmuramic acid 6-phosphate etherase n=1 Tax=Paenibacillus antri TaxID=2582848 RepID=A0A5R9G3H7_9BACL|nr:N-acetylmuramic acid 6-phosphate etherase [Paenibacillus antri]TLS50917.1 N-acetylmuramic acid 6-phosphate etherase [Paenibacillus antri]